MTDRRTISNGYFNGGPCKHCGGTLRYLTNKGCANRKCRNDRRAELVAEDPERMKRQARAITARADAKTKESMVAALGILRNNLGIPACREVFILLSPREAKMKGLGND